jgi:hypothetical protein
MLLLSSFICNEPNRGLIKSNFKYLKMSAIVNFSLDLTKLPKDKMIKGKKGTYINLSLSLNDQTNQFGSNASVVVTQSKEEREAKQDRVYVGNGKVIWTDGTITTADKENAPALTSAAQQPDREDDLPF